MMVRKYHYIIFGITTLVLIGSTENANADLTYDKKLKFNSEKEQIIGHIISALSSIQNEDYDVAKMHLMHPLAVNFPKIQSIVSHDNLKLDELELTLKSLTFVDPKNNYELLHYKLTPIFKIINNIERKIVGDKLENDPIFQLELVVLLLEKSTQYHEEYLELDDEISKKTKKQDSLSVAIKSHMLLKEGFEENFKTDFIDLFLSYEHDIDNVPILERQIIEKIKGIITKNISLKDNDTIKVSTKPTIFLSTTKYTGDNFLVILEGKNFNENQMITIEYFSPNSDVKEIIKGKTTSEGVIYFPLEFTQDTSNSYVFSVISGEIELYESLIPQ